MLDPEDSAENDPFLSASQMENELLVYLTSEINSFKLSFFSHKEPKHFIIEPLLPEVAELVDALDSGSSVRKDVRVQISLSAPTINIIN